MSININIYMASINDVNIHIVHYRIECIPTRKFDIVNITNLRTDIHRIYIVHT